MRSPLWALLSTYSLQELRQNPWRNAAAILSVMLGVALAFSVHLINASALDAFSQALRSSTGQADLELQSMRGNAAIPLTWYAQLLHHPDVALALPLLERSSSALLRRNGSVQGVALRVLGVDSLRVAQLAPDLQPQVHSPGGRLDLLGPDQVFLNPSARAALGSGPLQLQLGQRLATLQIAGSVSASGAPLAVMDIAAAQELFATPQQLTRIQLRLRPGVERGAFIQSMQARADWSADLLLAAPEAATQRSEQMSRAYRVNLTVLALMALFTGAFLVFSVLSLSITRRARQFALLAVLGLTSGQRLRLVLLEATLLGALGSVLGIALGSALAALALRWLGGDLGGGYFSSQTPALQWHVGAALAFASLGLGAAWAGAWWPARLAQQLAPAQTLKGLDSAAPANSTHWLGPALLLVGAGLTGLPPVGGIALAAYFSIGLLLLGGIISLPGLIGLALNRIAPWVQHRPLALLAVERARRVRGSAAMAVSGIVAALSLAVALTVMVSSFRDSVTQWLDSMLPAPLYLRSSTGGSNSSAYLDDAFVQAAASVPGVERLRAQHSETFSLQPALPALTLLVRPLHDGPLGTLNLPLLQPALPVPSACIGIYVSEALLDLYGARAGSAFAPLQGAFPGAPGAPAPCFFVAGVWRDYARQFGSIAIDLADYTRLRGAPHSTDLALWLRPDADPAQVEQALRQQAQRSTATPDSSAADLLEFSSSAEIRQRTLQIFDRSFAVTYWLQTVAIGIGLFGVAASFSAQVLARRKEFGLLVHLGLRRRQILQLLAAEALVWTSLGSLAGIALGLLVSEVLVRVVNPQSFHWSMDLSIPWLRLFGLGLAVIAAGTLTAWLAGRSAAGSEVLRAVREDC